MNALKDFEKIRALCEVCGNPIYLRKRDRKIVCSSGKMLDEGYIPLSKRCFESIENVVSGN